IVTKKEPPDRDIVCYHCGARGHIARSCPKKKPEQLMTTGDHSAKYYKAATINGCEAEALIDTGSSYCTARASVAIRSGLLVRPTDEILTGFGGHKTKPLGVTNIDVTIDGITGHDVPLLVVPDAAQPMDLLVGRTWTEQAHIVLVKYDDELRICSKDMPLSEIEPFKKPSKGSKIRIAETTSVPKGINFVNIEVDLEDGPVVLNNSLSGQLFLVESGKIVDVPLYSPRDCLLAKGSSLGKVEAVDIVNSCEENRILTASETYSQEPAE